MGTADWASGDRHSTSVEEGDGVAHIVRTLDATSYSVGLRWNAGTLHRTDDPHFLLIHPEKNVLELVVTYANGLEDPLVGTVDETFRAAAAWWEAYWLSGAAVDMAYCTDPRAEELERRIVLSQYLTAVNCSGRMPPQETGLVANSWQGKFHLEMHWWHAAHFAPWGRPELLAKSIEWYHATLSSRQGVGTPTGVRGRAVAETGWSRRPRQSK